MYCVWYGIIIIIIIIKIVVEQTKKHTRNPISKTKQKNFFFVCHSLEHTHIYILCFHLLITHTHTHIFIKMWPKLLPTTQSEFNRIPKWKSKTDNVDYICHNYLHNHHHHHHQTLVSLIQKKNHMMMKSSRSRYREQRFYIDIFCICTVFFLFFHFFGYYHFSPGFFLWPGWSSSSKNFPNDSGCFGFGFFSTIKSF